MQNQLLIDPTWTVSETLTRYPEAAAVFNELGIHMCCGSNASLKDAARRDGVDFTALLEGLRQAVEHT